MGKKKTVCILFGGQSSEHEVSRVSAHSVIKNLNKDKYDIVIIGITKEGKWLLYQGSYDDIISDAWEKGHTVKSMITPDATINGIIRITNEAVVNAGIDVVFPVLHGKFGEDGTIQGLLELAKIPYVGSGVLASSIGMDKAYAKKIFKIAGIPQADWEVVLKSELPDMESIVSRLEGRFSYPVFVKPANAGSSVGITKAHDKEELKEALILASKYDRKILVEEFIDGREIECAVLGNDNPQASITGEIKPCNEFYDYDAKYNDDRSELIIPAEIPKETEDEIRSAAVKAFKELDCSGLARVDFFVHNKTGEIYINELNTMPGFTNISMYPKLWEATGISYSELLDRLIELALEQQR